MARNRDFPQRGPPLPDGRFRVTQRACRASTPRSSDRCRGARHRRGVARYSTRLTTALWTAVPSAPPPPRRALGRARHHRTADRCWVCFALAAPTAPSSGLETVSERPCGTVRVDLATERWDGETSAATRGQRDEVGASITPLGRALRIASDMGASERGCGGVNLELHSPQRNAGGE